MGEDVLPSGSSYSDEQDDATLYGGESEGDREYPDSSPLQDEDKEGYAALATGDTTKVDHDEDDDSRPRTLMSISYTFCLTHDTSETPEMLLGKTSASVEDTLRGLFTDDKVTVGGWFSVEEKHLRVQSVESEILKDSRPDDLTCEYTSNRRFHMCPLSPPPPVAAAIVFVFNVEITFIVDFRDGLFCLQDFKC